MDVEFNFSVKQRGKKYLLVAKRFGVVVWADNLVSGVEELQKRVADVAAEFDKAGIVPESDSAEKETLAESKSRRALIVKSALAAAFLLLFIAVELSIFSTFFGPTSLVGSLLSHPAQFIIRLGNRAEAIPPTEVDQIKFAIREIMKKTVPLLEEIKSTPNPAREKK